MAIGESTRDPAAPTLVGLPADYAGTPGHFDEAVTADGATRVHWRKLLDAIADAPPDALQARDDMCRRLLREYGITYQPPGSDLERERPWLLDSWPLVIAADEWETLRAGVSQRARLLNAILADIYGKRELLVSGELPPEIVFANPAFLRAASGIQPAGGSHLTCYAVDVARAPNGRWWVVGDRTDTPAGAGYALENRIVLNRVHPELMRDYQVQRLARYFAALRDRLLALAPSHVDEPRVVILTPGPYSSTYSEQAYLARYLGISLVEGRDLTVRDQEVFLKTLDGLLPVQVILRRLDSGYCDPLELREESLLGIPGLLQAVRAGNVQVANAMGAGVVETPALLPFLTPLCRRLLGEELLMPPVATWWCGQQPALDFVIQNRERLVVTPAFSRGESIAAWVDRTNGHRILEELRTRPHMYVAQEFVRLSTAPAWHERRLQPRHVMLRLFAVAQGDGDYAVMPGGLTRSSESQESILMSAQTGGGSKDTWVLGATQPDGTTLLPAPGRAIALSRAGFVLPSRLADDLFWLGRYAERIEFGCRMARCVMQRLADQTELGHLQELSGLVDLWIDHGRLPPICAENAAWTSERLEELAWTAAFSTENSGSIAADVARLHGITIAVRDRLSTDAWRLLHALRDTLRPMSSWEADSIDSQLALLDSVLARLSAFSGQAMDGMTRDKGWHFLEIGRRLERAADVADLLRCGLARCDGADDGRLLAILEVANSAMTYRSRYVFGPEVAPALDLLLADEKNPRSIAFQLAELHRCLRVMHDSREDARRSAPMKLVTSVFSEVRLLDVDDLAALLRRGHRAQLSALLRRVRRAMESLSRELTRTYLAHVLATQPVRGARG